MSLQGFPRIEGPNHVDSKGGLGLELKRVIQALWREVQAIDATATAAQATATAVAAQTTITTIVQGDNVTVVQEGDQVTISASAPASSVGLYMMMGA